MNLRIWTLVIMLVALSSCAQPPTKKVYSYHKNDFASRLELNVHYEEPETLSLYLSNPKQTQVYLWLVMNHSVPGERVLRETLVHDGTDSTLHRIYRLPQGSGGITGALYIRVLSEDDKELIRSNVVQLTPNSKGD